MVISVKNNSNHSDQRVLCEELLYFTPEKAGAFSLLFESAKGGGMEINMQCKCFRIQLLEGKKKRLNDILEMSSTVNTYDSSCLSDMTTLRSKSWSATESLELLNDIEILLTMTDELQSAHTLVVDAITKGLEIINTELEEDIKEDEEFHKAEEEKAKASVTS